MRLLPRTLLVRTFLLLAALMLLSVLAWFAVFSLYEREPRARQLAQTLVSVANLTRAALVSARPDARHGLLAELSDREGIHVYPAEPNDSVAPLPDNPFLQKVLSIIRQELGETTRMSLEMDGERALFVSFRLDDSDEGEFWLVLPSERLNRAFPLEWLGWGSAALLLSLVGAWLIVARVARPLKLLAHAARITGQGGQPPPVPETGPVEMETVARSFNQMTRDLARLDQDRALILAGVSHDLRTPLTRLRMGIEMAAIDEESRQAMVVDVEEMDRTIGQFLVFARGRGEEPTSPTDLPALLAEMAESYRRRGLAVETELPSLPPVELPVDGLRRCVGNLVENAVRHGGGGTLRLSLRMDPGNLVIEVADRGPGIPAHEAERLKLPFTRLESARSNTGGSGLGLAIVDRWTRGRGGRLELLPREGGGLLARITIPAP